MFLVDKDWRGGVLLFGVYYFVDSMDCDFEFLLYFSVEGGGDYEVVIFSLEYVKI